MTTNPSTESIHCSFCAKPESEVNKIIAGPGIYICNECVDRCTTILTTPPPAAADEPAGRPRVRPWDDMSVDDILAQLPRIARVGAQVEGSLKAWVRRARQLGATWTRIGASLGMKRQSAWKRFSDEE